MDKLRFQSNELIGMQPRVDWEEDFLGVTSALMIAGGKYGARTAGTPTTDGVLLASDTQAGSGGILNFLLAATDEAEATGIDMADVVQWSPLKNLVFECRLAVTTLPFLDGAAAVIHWGMDSAYNATAATIARYLRFIVTGAANAADATGLNGYLYVDAYDGATATWKLLATGIKLVAGVYHTYRIDCSNPSDIRFYVDGVQVCTTYTIAWGAAVVTLLQPMVMLNKTGTGTDISRAGIYLDYIRICQDR